MYSFNVLLRALLQRKISFFDIQNSKNEWKHKDYEKLSDSSKLSLFNTILTKFQLSSLAVKVLLRKLSTCRKYEVREYIRTIIFLLSTIETIDFSLSFQDIKKSDEQAHLSSFFKKIYFENSFSVIWYGVYYHICTNAS